MRAEDIALALGGKRSGRQWACKCPAHNDSSPSLIVFDGHSDVQVRCLAGCEPQAVIAALRRRGIWQAGGRPLPAAPLEPVTTPDTHRELAISIFMTAKDPRGTIVERYLWSRGLTLPLFALGTVLRFAKDCPRGSRKQPALVALMRDVDTDAPAAIQRIYLTSDARKDGAMMLGPAGNAAMKLGGPALGDPDALYICEGLETGLALCGAGYSPLWALGSAGAIQRFPTQPHVSHLIICADNDDAGLNAADTCALRWRAHGQMVTVWHPEQDGLDFADLDLSNGQGAA